MKELFVLMSDMSLSMLFETMLSIVTSTVRMVAGALEDTQQTALVAYRFTGVQTTQAWIAIVP